MMYCPKCGKEISNSSKFCQECGYHIITNDDTNTETISKPVEVSLDKTIDVEKKSNKTKKVLRTIVIATVAIIVMVISLLCIIPLLNDTPTNDNGADTESSLQGESINIVKSDIEMVEKILGRNRDEVLSQYSNATEDGNDILIKGTFANIKGTYNIYSYENVVFNIIFVRDDKITDVDKVVGDICECLGDYESYDSKWNSYEWNTDTLELSLYVDERIYFSLVEEDNNDNGDSGIPPLKNNKKAEETTIAYPVNSSVYMNLSADDINTQFDVMREMITYNGSHKNIVLNAYDELGDDDWNKLYMDGKLFGIKGQYAFMYSDDIIDDFGFHWVMDDYDMHSSQILYCLNTYFGEYEKHNEFYSNGVTYNQYKWHNTTDDTWHIHLSLSDNNRGWLQITPSIITEDVEKESYVKDGKFTITANKFKDGFEDAFDNINEYDFSIKVVVDESKSFYDVDNYVSYKIQDKENNYSDVGMISFTKPNGKTLHISEEFSTDCWDGVNMLIERSSDVSAAVVATIFAIDPGIGYSEAFDVAQDIVDNVSVYSGDISTLKSVEHNNIRYILYKDNKYHYLIVTTIQ